MGKDAWAVPGHPLTHHPDTLLTSSSPTVPLEEGSSPPQKLPVDLFRKMLTFAISVTAQVMLLLSNSKMQE